MKYAKFILRLPVSMFFSMFLLTWIVLDLLFKDAVDETVLSHLKKIWTVGGTL
jgi:hypothetical protein